MNASASPVVPTGIAASPSGDPAAIVAASPRRLLVPFIVAVAFLMEQIDATVITASLPAMAQSLGAQPLSLNLAITSYVLSLAVFIPISGWVADRYGAKLVFLAAIGVFMVGSTLCGFATSLPVLVASRILQGLGGAMMTPVGRLILLRSFPRSELVVAMAYMNMPVLIGPLLGPLIGGLLTTYASWRYIFFVNIPIGLLGILLTLRFIPEIAVSEAARRRSFDFFGFLLVGAALALLQTSIENLVHAFMPGALAWFVFAAAIGLFAGYWVHARGREAPALAIDLVSIRAFRVGTLVGGLSRIGLNGVPFLLQLQLQLGFGYTPIHASLLVFLSAAGSLAMKPITTTILRAIGFRTLLVVNSVAGAALVGGFTFLRPETPVVATACYIFVYGISRTLQFNGVQTLSFSEVPSDRQSGAVGFAGVIQQLTMGLGISLSAGAVSMIAGDAAIPTAHDFSRIFLLMAAVPLAALPGFLLLHPEDGREASRHTPRRSRARERQAEKAVAAQTAEPSPP